MDANAGFVGSINTSLPNAQANIGCTVRASTPLAKYSGGKIGSYRLVRTVHLLGKVSWFKGERIFLSSDFYSWRWPP